jgi:DNA-binding response OmpR family regulator
MALHLALLLCTDDEVHDMAASWLAEGGMSAISASGVDDAVKRIADVRIDLLVLDTLPIYIPGLPSLRKLKEEQPPLRVILIPRIDERPEVGLARISGVDAVLLRPVSKAKLLSVVACTTRHPPAHKRPVDRGHATQRGSGGHSKCDT